MSNQETNSDWSNAYNYTMADEAEALKAHLNKALDEVKDLKWKLKLSQMTVKSHRQVLELWQRFSKTGELEMDTHARKLLDTITEIALIKHKGDE
jgi:hypothetical protein